MIDRGNVLRRRGRVKQLRPQARFGFPERSGLGWSGPADADLRCIEADDEFRAAINLPATKE